MLAICVGSKTQLRVAKVSFDLDELVIVDVSRNGEKCSDAFLASKSMANSTFLPITVGGGIRSLEVASRAFDSGADKLLFNSSLANAPELISEIASSFGRQAVVGCVDYQHINGARSVLIEQGQIPTGESVQEIMSRYRKLPLGELILNSIDRDGTGFGLD